jgi:hypothetical protein
MNGKKGKEKKTYGMLCTQTEIDQSYVTEFLYFTPLVLSVRGANKVESGWAAPTAPYAYDHSRNYCRGSQLISLLHHLPPISRTYVLFPRGLSDQ